MPSLVLSGLLTAASMFAVVNPISAVPVVQSTTSTFDAVARSVIVRRAILAATITLCVFAAGGSYILALFGVSPLALKAAAGVLFAAMAWDEIGAHPTRDKATSDELDDAARHQADHDPSILPLAIPTLAGPGAMTTALTQVGQASDWPHVAIVYVSILAVMAVSWLILRIGPALLSRLGTTGMNVLTRIFGLMLLAIACEFLLDVIRTVGVDIVHSGRIG